MEILATCVVGATWMSFLVTGFILARWDIRDHRLPNKYVAMALAGGLLGFALLSAIEQSWESLARGLMGGGICVLVFAIAHIVGGMGMGDVKYSAVVGLYLGWLSWESIYWGVLSAFGLAAFIVATSAIRRKALRSIPFGPFMTLGVVLTGVMVHV